MSNLMAQLQQENERLTVQCSHLDAELAGLRQAYEQLSKSEARYRQVFDNSPICISFLSSAGHHIEANAAFKEHYGFTVQDSQRVGFNLFTDPQLEENGTRPYMLRALAGETVIEPPTNFYDASRLYGKKAAERYTPGQGHYFPIWNEVGEVEEIVEMSPSVTDLLEAQAEVLAERDRADQERAQLLSTVAQVANLLLRSSDYATVLPDVVRLLGEAVGSDRCAITQAFLAPATNQHTVRLLTEWCRVGIPSVLLGSPEFEQGIVIEKMSSFLSQLSQGEAANFIVSDLQEPAWRNFFEAHNNISMLIVPVMIDNHCWGHIGFDNCGEPRLHDEAEIAILQVAAESIAAAIERQVKNDALRESEKRYRQLIELTSEGIYRYQFDEPMPVHLPVDEKVSWLYQHFKIVEHNLGFAEMYHYDQADALVGTRLTDFHENLTDNYTGMVKLFNEGHRARNIETVEIDRTGHKKYFLINVFDIIEDGFAVGGWGTQIDITELRETQQTLLEIEQARSQELEQLNAELQQTLNRLSESEERYRTLFELSNEGIYRFELNDPIPLSLSPEERLKLGYRVNQIVEANQAFAEQYGYNRPEEIVGARLSDFYDNQHLQTNDRSNTALMRDLQVSKIETVETDRLGNRRWLISSAVCETRNDYIVGGWGVQTDITELKKTQQALLEAEQARSQELEQLNAELQKSLDEVINRDRIAETASMVTNLLLTVDNLQDAITQALHILGEALNLDRVVAVEFPASSASVPRWQVLYEWDSPKTIAQIAHPRLKQGTFEGIENWFERLRQGQVISHLLEEIPEPFRSGQAELGVKALHVVPIFVAGNLWGTIGIDDCCQSKRLSQTELSMLKISADCIGSAIQRDRTQKAMLQTEQARSQELEQLNEELQQTLAQLQVRDRILEATATAANTLLTTENLQTAVDIALQIIGESLDTDRVNIIEIEAFETSSDLSSVGWQILNEWHSSHTLSQSLHPDYRQGDHAGIETWLEHFANGQSLSCLLEEMPEPFRSGQAAIGIKAYHTVPIFVAGQYWGNLGLDDCREAKRRNAGELAVLKTAAACIGSAIQRDRTQKAMLQAEQDRAAQLAKTNQALKNNLDRLAADPDLNAFLDHVLIEISQQLNIQTALIQLYNPLDHTLQTQHWVEQGKVQPQQRFSQLGPLAEPISIDDTPIWERLLKTKFPFVITADNADQFAFRGTQDWQIQWANRQGLQSGINILLTLGDTPLGLLALLSADRSEYSSEDLELAQALSHQATLAIQLTRLAEEAKQSAILGERNRLAREVHDTLAQAFGGILMQLQAADYFAANQPKKAWNHVQTAQKLSQDGLTEARRSVWTLYLESTEYEDLYNAIAQFIQQKQAEHTIPIHLTMQGVPYALHPDLGLNLLRIVQEFITNTLRHAEAQTLQIDLHYAPEELQLTIHDDGCGFDPRSPSSGFGLTGMQQRASRVGATWQLVSRPGQGTLIKLTVANPDTLG